jgi:2-polyprenyl-3-methyl-5-hydroxy-6-metoxy-1,4-benzoquinol methylase
MASIPPAETLAPEEHGKFLSGYASTRVFFTYYKCSDCEALYCPTYYSHEQLDQLYSRQAENMAEVPLVARLRTQKAYFKLLMRYSRMAGGFLEIGSDIGFFAETCARTGAFEHFWLYEPNREVHDQLVNRFQHRSFTIRSANFTSADVPAGSISTAVMVHVLDHLLDPGQMLREIYRSLEPRGVLFVVTHDAQSLLARVLARRWPPFTLQHPHLFSPRSMEMLFTKCGFETVEITKSLNYFPATYLLRAAFTVLGINPYFIPDWEWPMLSLKLGNIAAIARKP